MTLLAPPGFHPPRPGRAWSAPRTSRSVPASIGGFFASGGTRFSRGGRISPSSVRSPGPFSPASLRYRPWVGLLRTRRLLLRHREEPDLPAFLGLYSRDDVMPGSVRIPTATWPPPTKHANACGDGMPANEDSTCPWAVGIVPLLPGTQRPVEPSPCSRSPTPAANRPDRSGLAPPSRPSGPGAGQEATRGPRGGSSRNGTGPCVTDPDNIPSQAVANRLGMRDEGLTERWFGLTMRQYRMAATRGPTGPIPR